MEKSSTGKVERVARLRWISIPKIEYPDFAQREKINMARVDHLAADFDLEQLGNPVVCEREGKVFCLDGMHRIEALKLIGWGDQQVQCWTYSDLSNEEMAERFLKLNDKLTVSAYDEFRIGVNAGRLVECDIDRIVRAQGLKVARQQGEGCVAAVGTLRKVYQRGGAAMLRETLVLIRDAYGTHGFEAIIIDGLSLLCQRYSGTLDFELSRAKLANAHGGMNALLNKSEKLRLATGAPKGQCVAAAAIEIINAGRGGKKLAAWFREDAA